jgi:hypothetical protein
MDLQLVEDMSAVAKETFKSHYSLIVLKTVARMLTKTAVSAGVGAALDSNDTTKGWGSLFSFASQIFNVASEQADTRSARYFPGKALGNGMNLAPGTYSITVNCYGPGNALISTERRDKVQIRSGQLNLVECVCLK